MKDQENKIASWFDRARTSWKHCCSTRGEPTLPDFEKSLYFDGIDYADELVKFTREFLGKTSNLDVRFMQPDDLVSELFENMKLVHEKGGAK